MKKNKLLLGLVLLLGVTSCKTPGLVFTGDLKNNTAVMDAKGRQGWQFNQVIKFGDYHTSPIARGWTRGGTINFFVRFQKAEQKLDFTQYTPDGKTATIAAVSSFKNTELPLLSDFLTYSFNYKNTFVGTIILNGDETQHWDFIIHDPDAGLSKDANCGVARDVNGNEIQILGVKKVEHQANWVQLDNFGFEFIMNGVSVGAVSTINNGRVWIKNDISDELKLVLASLSSSLMVRQNIDPDAK